jgi:hypothetical protein
MVFWVVMPLVQINIPPPSSVLKSKTSKNPARSRQKLAGFLLHLPFNT